MFSFVRSFTYLGLFQRYPCRRVPLFNYIDGCVSTMTLYALFSSLIKMLYWMCDKSDNPPTWPQLEHAIKRNFGGLESTELDPVKIFMDKLPCRREPPDLSGVPEEVNGMIHTVLSIIILLLFLSFTV